jgi:hypothetical protein
MNPPLIPQEQLDAAQARYFQQHPTPAMKLVALAKARPELTAKELGVLVGYGAAWARKVLKQANVPYAGRKAIVLATAATPCKCCGHPRGGPAAMNARQPSHCPGGVIHHNHWSHPVPKWICESPHCTVPGCDCTRFVKP